MAKSSSYGAIPPEYNDCISLLPVTETVPSNNDVDSTRQRLNGEGSHHIAPTASLLSEFINITKNLIGGGVLSLSGGIALFSDNPKASFSAIAWVVVCGAILAHFCLLIGKTCEGTRSFTYRGAWEKSVGHQGGMIVAVVNTLDPLVGLFGNASIMAQSLQLMLEGMHVHWTVVECLLVITVIGILPLCLMKNLSALAPFSAVGLLAVLFTLAVMVLRYLDGSYLPGGVYYEVLPTEMKPSFGTRNRPWSTDALPFVCMVFTSFDMHYNSPRYYAELQDASVPRFRKAVFFSFMAGSILLVSIALAGFLTFGGNSDSFVLNNYSPHDPLMTLSRLTIGLSSLAAYPLNFIGVRDNCLDIIGIADRIDTTTKLNCFTILLLSMLTVTNCFATDLGLINSVGGGTTVALVDFVFPALMFRALVRNKRGTIREHLEARLSMILMVVCVVLGLIGVWDSITVSLGQ